MAGDPPEQLRLSAREVLASGGRAVAVEGPVLEEEAGAVSRGSFNSGVRRDLGAGRNRGYPLQRQGIVSEAEIQSVSDTAFLIAHFRAAESARPDALFHDPLAARLAGKKGRRLARASHAGNDGVDDGGAHGGDR